MHYNIICNPVILSVWLVYTSIRFAYPGLVGLAYLLYFLGFRYENRRNCSLGWSITAVVCGKSCDRTSCFLLDTLLTVICRRSNRRQLLSCRDLTNMRYLKNKVKLAASSPQTKEILCCYLLVHTRCWTYAFILRPSNKYIRYKSSLLESFQSVESASSASGCLIQSHH